MATITIPPIPVPTGRFFDDIFGDGPNDGPSSVGPNVSPSDVADYINCHYVVPDVNGHVPWGSCHSYYLYYPSQVGNAVFAVLFGLVAIAHFQQMCHYRKLYCIVAVAAALAEFVAFVARAVGARMQQQGDIVSGSNFVFLLAPLFINAFVYMTYSRLMRHVLSPEDPWRARYRWLSHCYFWLMLAAAILQTAAAGIMFTNHAGTFASAQKVYVGGLAVQAIFNLEFAYVAVRASGKLAELDRNERPMKRAKLLMWAVMAALGLLMVRIIYRVVDFSLGQKTSNPLATSEVPAFVLDALPMFLILLLFVLWHPGRVLYMTPEQKRQMLEQQGIVAPVYAHYINEAPPEYEPRQPSQVPVAVLADEPHQPGADMVKQRPASESEAESSTRHDSDDDAIEPVSPMEEDRRTMEKAMARKSGRVQL